MLNFDDLTSLAMLVELGERDTAKQLAARLLANADTAELWTIARAADILDRHSPTTAKAHLGKFARTLTDEHRRALVLYCATVTGDRPRRALPDPAFPRFGLSVFHDTQPGYDEHDAQPAGLTVHPTPWQTRHARHRDQLTRHLRDAKNQLPAHVRTEMRAIPTTDTTRCRPPKSRAQQKAERHTNDYMRTRLRVDDRTVPAGYVPTVFDCDDDIPTAPAEPPPGYAFNPDQAANIHLRVTPCVWCFIERRPQDAPRNRHDDGLCSECRDHQRPGLPAPTVNPRPARPTRTVAYLNPAARAAAARAASVTAPCATVAAHLPRAAALVWMRAYYRLVADAEDAWTVCQWVKRWLAADHPQPPTTPAPIAPIQPAHALAAA